MQLNVNLMQLNFEKCKIMRFSRITPISTIYFLSGHQISSNLFIDVGILFDRKLSFISHIMSMINKGRMALGYYKITTHLTCSSHFGIWFDNIGLYLQNL